MLLRRSCAVRFVLRIAMLGLLAFFSSLSWGASEGFQPVSPEELKMTSEPMAAGASALILYRQVDRDDAGGGKSHEYDYLRIKILTEEGRKYANVEIPFDKANANIINIHARTIKPDGSIVEFHDNVFEKEIVKARGIKYLAKTFTLPEVRVGGIIEYYFTIDFSDNFIYNSHWILSQDLFTKNAEFSLKPYKSNYEPISLRMTWQGLPPGSQPKEDSNHITRMTASNIPAFQVEDYMPPENEMRSRVDFIYQGSDAQTDPAKFWEQIGKRRNEALETFIGKKKAMQDAVSQIISPSDAPEVKLRKIYDRVQQIRNTSYEVEKTQQEEKRAKEKAVENVEDIWKRGYADGMQLTWLYLALARAAGFEAYGCWVSGRSEYFFNPKSEQSEKLDANVVQVKLNGKDLYFDPGAAFTPFGMLIWEETATPGLCLNKDGGTWIKTSLPASSESTITHTGKLTLSDTGDLEGKVVVTYTGLEAMDRRREARNWDEVARKKFLEDNLKEQVSSSLDAAVTNKPDWASSETPLVAEFDVKIPGWASSAGKRALVPAALFTAREKEMFETANRVHPIYFAYPYEKSDDFTIELPSGWDVMSVPTPQTQDAHSAVYILKVENNKQTLRLTRRLTVNILLLDQKYYPTLRNFFQVVRTGDEEQVVLQPHATAASN